jgi:hypothetical protein
MIVKMTIGPDNDPVIGGKFGSHHWPLRYGLNAPEVVWAFPPALAAKLLAITPNAYGARETSYTITTPKGLTRTRSRVIVVREAPSNDPNIRYLVLTDVRWYLPRAFVKAFYNLRVPSGATTLVNADGSPINTVGINYVLTYAPFSLKGGSPLSPGVPWTADQIMADVFSVFTTRFGIQFVSGARSRGNYVPNDVDVEGPGNVALAQAMAVAGGVDMWVNRAGALVTCNAFMGAERQTVTSSVGYSLEGKGTIKWIDMGLVAPPIINCLLEREIEVRADAWGQVPAGATDPNTGASLGSPVPLPADQNPTMEFVFPVTDFELSHTPAQNPTTGFYDGSAGYYQSNLGSFLQEDQAFTAQATDPATHPDGTPGNPPLGYTDLPWNRQTLCKLFLGGTSLMADCFANDPTGAQPPNAPWNDRVTNARGYFHGLVRLNRNFSTLTKPGSIKAVRAQMLDASNQTRAKAQAFCDYAQRPSLRGMATPSSSVNPAGWNVNAWPSSDASFNPQAPGYVKNYGAGPGQPESFPNNPTPLTALKAAPFEVTVADSVNGIFALQVKRDPWGFAADIAPGLVNNVPGVDLMDIETSKQDPFWQDASMCYTHRLALVFTCTPAGPNGEGQFHQVPVPYTVALQTLGVSTAAVSAKGPNLDRRLRQQSARIPWQDSQRSAILASFQGVTNTAQSEGASAGVVVGGLSAQNPGQGLKPINLAELDNADPNTPGYAQAEAAVIMAAFLDHFEGTATIGWCPDVTPVGSLVEITEEVDANGCIYSTFHCRPVTPPIQPMNLMSQAARSKLFGNLGSGTTA